MTGSTKQPRNIPALPPWLWLWIILFLIKAPSALAQFWGAFSQSISETSKWQVYGSPLVPLLEGTTLLQMLPLLTLTLGIGAVFIPHLRASYIKRRYRLRDDVPRSPALTEILDFLSSQAPRLDVKVNLLRQDQLAFVYPLGYRGCAVALFGGLVILWRRNKPAAQAVLLHEIAHAHHGDALVVGAGSLLEQTIRRWWLLALLFVALPIFVVWIDMSARSIFEWREINKTIAQSRTELAKLQQDLKSLGLPTPELPTSAPGISTILWHKTNQLFQLIVSNLGLMIVASFLWTAAVFIVPIFAIWCCEFNADRAAAKVQTKPVLLDALANHGNTRSFWHWLLSRVSHPPITLRRWAVEQSDHWLVLPLLRSLFPFAYVIRLILLLAWGTAVYLSLGKGLDGVEHQMLGWVGTYLSSVVPELLVLGFALVVWPSATRILHMLPQWHTPKSSNTVENTKERLR